MKYNIKIAAIITLLGSGFFGSYFISNAQNVTISPFYHDYGDCTIGIDRRLPFFVKNNSTKPIFCSGRNIRFNSNIEYAVSHFQTKNKFDASMLIYAPDFYFEINPGDSLQLSGLFSPRALFSDSAITRYFGTMTVDYKFAGEDSVYTTDPVPFKATVNDDRKLFTMSQYFSPASECSDKLSVDRILIYYINLLNRTDTTFTILSQQFTPKSGPNMKFHGYVTQQSVTNNDTIVDSSLHSIGKLEYIYAVCSQSLSSFGVGEARIEITVQNDISKEVSVLTSEIYFNLLPGLFPIFSLPQRINANVGSVNKINKGTVYTCSASSYFIDSVVYDRSVWDDNSLEMFVQDEFGDIISFPHLMKPTEQLSAYHVFRPKTPYFREGEYTAYCRKTDGTTFFRKFPLFTEAIGTGGVHEEIAANGGYYLYPNPSGGMITITNQSVDLCSSILQIINLLGSRTYTPPINYSNCPSSVQIDVRDLPIGTYYMLASSHHGKSVLPFTIIR